MTILLDYLTPSICCKKSLLRLKFSVISEYDLLIVKCTFSLLHEKCTYIFLTTEFLTFNDGSYVLKYSAFLG